MATAARFLVLWSRPDYPASFERHYWEVHIPLALKIPGLRRYTVSRNIAPVRGEESHYLVRRGRPSAGGRIGGNDEAARYKAVGPVIAPRAGCRRRRRAPGSLPGKVTSSASKPIRRRLAT